MCRKIPATGELTNIYVLSNKGPTLETLSLFSSHRKNWFAASCEPVFAMTGICLYISAVHQPLYISICIC